MLFQICNMTPGSPATPRNAFKLVWLKAAANVRKAISTVVSLVQPTRAPTGFPLTTGDDWWWPPCCSPSVAELSSCWVAVVKRSKTFKTFQIASDKFFIIHLSKINNKITKMCNKNMEKKNMATPPFTVLSLSPWLCGMENNDLTAQWASECPPRRPNGVKTWGFPPCHADTDTMPKKLMLQKVGWQNGKIMPFCTRGCWFHSLSAKIGKMCCLRNEEKCLQSLSLSLRSGSSRRYSGADDRILASRINSVISELSPVSFRALLGTWTFIGTCCHICMVLMVI